MEDKKSKEKKNKKKKKPESERRKKIMKLIRFVVTNFGMLLITLVYCVGGAFLFQILEMQNILQNCQSAQGASAILIQDYRLEIYNYLRFNVTWDPVLAQYQNLTIIKDGPEVYNQVILDTLTRLRSDALSNGYAGQDCQATNKWNFPSAFLWCVTVVSTIGI